jgi:branched-chain amino acid transport system substrate-binding protein
MTIMACVSAAMLASGDARALDKEVKVGVLTDYSGVYADLTGPGSELAAQMAAEDSGLRQKGWQIDVVVGDHLNKADIGSAIARKWMDIDKVDVIVDLPNSSVLFAVNNLVKEKNKVLMASGGGSVDLTNSQCSPNTVHWTFDTYMLAHSTGAALVKNGGDSWFFITADYAFGNALERDTTSAVKALNGTVVGSVKHPLNSSDFSSYLVQARASNAKVIGLANAGGDAINTIKQASEFGIVSGGQKLAGMLMFIADVHSLGLKVAQGLNFTETFYWDMNDGTRAFSKRFQARMKNAAMPTMAQAGVYASLIHYLKAIETFGGNPDDGRKVVEKMKDMPTDDPLFGIGKIEPNGRAIHPAYLFEVKTPAQSKGPWDYYNLVATVPADEAFLPLSESTCFLLKK